MSRWLRVIPITVGIVLLLVAVLYLIKGDEIQRLMAVNNLYQPSQIAQNFSHSSSLFYTQSLPTMSDAPTPLLSSPQPLEDIEAFLQERHITAFVVLHDGKLVDERYLQGTDQDDLRVGWGLSIAALNLLVGIALEQGHIESLDDPVTKYARNLIGTSYDGPTIRNLLHMSSGVSFNESRLNPRSDIHRMERSLAWGRSIVDFIEKRRPRSYVAGHRWHYTSLDAEVLGEILTQAIPDPITDWIAQSLFWPLGVEQAPTYLSDKQGRLFFSAGLTMRARDFARLGQVMLDQGVANDHRIVSSSWIEETFIPFDATQGLDPRFGYLWWLPQDQNEPDYFVQGAYGQYLYIHPKHRTVIVSLAADRSYEDPRARPQTLALFRHIAQTLDPQEDLGD